MSITVTTSIKPSPSSEGISCSGTQLILCRLHNSTAHNRVHRITLLNPVLTQLNPLSTFTPHFHKIRFNNIF
jgi:hypothetical protein